MTDFERLMVATAAQLIDEDAYPSVPAIREKLRRVLGARTPSYSAIDHIRKSLLERGLFPLAGGRSASAKQAHARKRERDRRPRLAPAKPPRYLGPLAGEMARLARLRRGHPG